jgi:hypothetical protein
MGAIVGVDALVLMSEDNGTTWIPLPERNEFSINIKVDTAEHKVFVTSLAEAWSDKRRTWMSWSGSLQGYYDDADDTIFDKVVEGAEVLLRFYDTRYENLTVEDVIANVFKYWQGKAILTSIDHGTGTEDFSTLNVDFEGIGKLNRVVTDPTP